MAPSAATSTIRVEHHSQRWGETHHGHVDRSAEAPHRFASSRTNALEQELRIGTGFHGKWYRSQRDHWLGWLVVQECRARSMDLAPDAVPARGVWQRLNCSPMMFWLADAAGAAPEALYLARASALAASAINPKDGAPHGTMMRRVLPWEIVETALARHGVSAALDVEALANDAFSRLVAKNASYRPLEKWLAQGN